MNGFKYSEWLNSLYDPCTCDPSKNYYSGSEWTGMYCSEGALHIQLIIITQFQRQKAVLFQAIQFNISMQFSYICPKDRTLSGATTPGQSGLGTADNEGVLSIPQSSSITETTPSDFLESYTGRSLVSVLPFYREAVSVFCCPSRLGNVIKISKNVRQTWV